MITHTFQQLIVAAVNLVGKVTALANLVKVGLCGDAHQVDGCML